MMCGASGSKYHLQGPENAVRQLSLHPGLNVAGARDDFLWCCHLDLLCFAAKLPLVGDDVEGLRYHLHWPMNYNLQVRV
jgi:hypothetical protein